MIVLDKGNLDSKSSFPSFNIHHILQEFHPTREYLQVQSHHMDCIRIFGLDIEHWTSIYSFPDEPQLPHKTKITLFTLDIWDPNRVHSCVLVWLLSPHYFTCINTVTLIALTSTTPKQSEPWKREKMWWKKQADRKKRTKRKYKP